MVAAGDLHPVSVEPINAGLVFCVGSHPNGSTLLGRDLVGRSAGSLLASGNLAAVNTDHGTWRCLESTSQADGGISFPSSAQLRSITTQRTFAFHGEIDAFGTWAHLISIPYAAGTWVQPWMAHSFRRQGSTGANLNTHAALGGTTYASVNSAGGFVTGNHWFVVAIDGAAGIARFYVDGFQVGGDVGFSTTPVDWGGSNQPVTILNRSSTSPGEGTDGRCFTAAIWNRVLSAAEIAGLVISPQRMFNPGGTADLTAIKFANEQTFRSHAIVNPNAPAPLSLQATLYHEPQVYRAHVLTVSTPPGSVGALEPVDGSALAVGISVESSPRQEWLGYGWGVADFNLAHWTATNIQRLCEDMGASIVRYFTPEGTDRRAVYLPHWDRIRTHGINKVFWSSFVYRTANAPQETAWRDGNPNYLSVPSNAPNINGVADGLASIMAPGGINPSGGTWVTLQNEPEGNQFNHPTVGGVGEATQAQINQHHRTLRSRLNSNGIGGVNILGLEWRHPENMIGEFDSFNSNDLFDDGTVQGQCYHIYNKGATDQYYDQRLMPQGLDLFSTESGDNGRDPDNLSSPYTAARFISGVNNGGRIEIQHAAIGGVDGDGKVQVLINSGTNQLRNWYAACKIISSHLRPGTRMRLCRSTDRPKGPDMPDNQASRMYIDARTCQCQPRQFVACGLGPDGLWRLVANNHAYDGHSPTTFAGGHYGAPSSPGPNQQLTVDIAELGSIDRVWDGQRATRHGGLSNTSVNMRTGRMRFTLAPGETLAITQRAASSGGEPPADALDRSAYSSTAAWINDLNARGKPGKIGPGTYTFTQRQALTQSIYGYGATKPIFRNAARTNSFLFIRASNVLVSGVRFENIEMPFISVDDTEATDWGDGLVPRSSYGYMMPEWSQASLYYNADLVNCSITNCEFDGCGVLFMGIRHFRVHDGLTFSHNVVTNGMAGVCLLGYRFQNIVFDHNSFTDMIGTRYAVGSANNTETLLLLGGINILDDAQIALSNRIFVRHNVGLNYTSSHGPNDKNAAVFMDVRGGSGITVEDNDVRNFYNTGGSHDSNAVYLKSKGNIRFRRNYWENIGAKPTATSMGSEAAYYEFKGGSDDITSEDDQFIGGAQSGDAPWIAAGTASNVILTRPIIRGWRHTQSSWGGASGRPGQPCIIHHWGGSVCRVVDADVDDCLRIAGPTSYLIAHRNDAAGVCNHSGWRSAFNNNQISQCYKGGSPATASLTNCQTKTGQTITITTGPS